MIRLRTLSLALCLSFAASTAWAVEPVLVIHGGAGLERKDVTPQDEAAIRTALALALKKGHEALAAGRPALDAVTAAIAVLEDDPLFNAGKGAVFTHDGKNELDASIMDGATLRAGAVANVHHVKNPILLSRAVMEHSPHVMMVGDGAEIFAKEQGIELVDPSYFRTERRWKQLQEALKEDAASGQAMRDPEASTKHFGTVGAVALDAQGHLAAGTSTGGMTDKRYGRVGDSPIIGGNGSAIDRLYTRCTKSKTIFDSPNPKMNRCRYARSMSFTRTASTIWRGSSWARSTATGWSPARASSPATCSSGCPPRDCTPTATRWHASCSSKLPATRSRNTSPRSRRRPATR